MICIAWWDSITVRQSDETWTFVAVGFQTLDAWILESYRKVQKCNMGHEHSVENWSRQTAQMLFEVKKIKHEPPKVSKKVISELKRKVGKRKTIKPWPYGS